MNTASLSLWLSDCVSFDCRRQCVRAVDRTDGGMESKGIPRRNECPVDRSLYGLRQLHQGSQGLRNKRRLITRGWITESSDASNAKRFRRGLRTVSRSVVLAKPLPQGDRHMFCAIPCRRGRRTIPTSYDWRGGMVSRFRYGNAVGFLGLGRRG